MIFAFTDKSPGSAAIVSVLIVGIYAFNIMFLFSRSNRNMPLIVAMFALLHIIVGIGLLIVFLTGGGDMLSDAEWLGLSIWFLTLGITTMIGTWKKR